MWPIDPNMQNSEEDIVRLSEKITSKKREHDPAVTGKKYFLMFNLYIGASHIPITMARTQINDKTPSHERAWKSVIHKSCEELASKMNWQNMGMRLWNIINLKNVKEVRKRAGARYKHWPDQKFLAMLCDEARDLWEQARQMGVIMTSHGGYDVFQRYVGKHKDDLEWYPMYHKFLQKLNEDDIKRVCTDGLESSCIFVKNHQTSQRRGQCTFQVGNGNKTPFVSYLCCHVTPYRTYPDSSKIKKLHPFPPNTFHGHVDGLCCNPLHYIVDNHYEVSQKIAAQWPTTPVLPDTEDWAKAEEHVANMVADIHDEINIPKKDFYLWVEDYSGRVVHKYTESMGHLKDNMPGMVEGLDQIVHNQMNVLGAKNTVKAMYKHARKQLKAMGIGPTPPPTGFQGWYESPEAMVAAAEAHAKAMALEEEKMDIK